MKITQQLNMVANTLKDPLVRDLLTDASNLLTIYERMAGDFMKFCAQIGGDIERNVLPKRVAEDLAAVFTMIRLAKELKGYSCCNGPANKKLVRYDEMDPASPPNGVKLEVCSNCHRLGRVKEGKKHVTFVHTAWRTKRGKVRARHYCKMSRDGMRMDVVIPVEPAAKEEEPKGGS